VKHDDYLNDRFFTVASHGFVLGSEVVHPHGPPNGRIVAIADKQMGNSDISIAKIVDPAITYTAEAFAGPDGTIGLSKLHQEQDCMIGGELFFDSPFTGLGTGTIVGHGVAVYPKDALQEEWLTCPIFGLNLLPVFMTQSPVAVEPLYITRMGELLLFSVGLTPEAFRDVPPLIL